ncbi:MAG: hypothetical protein Q9220_007049 [cf. Caloplaca sp. 1 TL-2023]
MQTQSQPLGQSGQKNGTPQKNKRGTKTGKVLWSMDRPSVTQCNKGSDEERTPTNSKKKLVKLEHEIATPPVIPDRVSNRLLLWMIQAEKNERTIDVYQPACPGPVAALEFEEVQRSRGMSEPVDARKYDHILKSKGDAPASAPPDGVSTPANKCLQPQLPEALVNSNQSSPSPPAQSSSDQEVTLPSGQPAEDDCSAEILDFPDQVSAKSRDDLIGNRMLDDSVLMALLHHGMRSQCVLVDCLALVTETPRPPSEARKSAARHAARIILPFHQAAVQHWILFVYYPRIHRLECFNSLASTTSSDCPSSVRKMLSSLLGRQIDSNIECHAIPSQQQSNSVDCGIYVIHHSHAICRGEFIVPTMAIDTNQLRRQYFDLLSSSSFSDSSVTRTTGATSTAHVEIQPPTPFAAGLQFAPSLHRPGSSVATHQSNSRNEAAKAYGHLLLKYNEAHAQYYSLFSVHHGLLEAQEQLILASAQLQPAEQYLQHGQALYTAWPGAGTSGVVVARQALESQVLPVVTSWLVVATEDIGRAQAGYEDWLEKTKKSEDELGVSRGATREVLEKREEIRAEIEEWVRYNKSI